jgi:hypothetical protein
MGKSALCAKLVTPLRNEKSSYPHPQAHGSGNISPIYNPQKVNYTNNTTAKTKVYRLYFVRNPGGLLPPYTLYPGRKQPQKLYQALRSKVQ